MNTELFARGGEMAALMSSLDWAATPIGAVENWPGSLQTSVSICLNSRFPILIWWGSELVMLYNDAYRPILGAKKHPKAMGQRGSECWPEVWDIIGPMLEGVLSKGEATWSDDQLLLLDRNGYIEECYFTFSYSPILDETGKVGGVFTAVTETTERVLSERRLRTLRELGAQTADAKTASEVCRLSAQTLAENPADIPFALLYLLDEEGKQAQVSATVGIELGTAVSPQVVSLVGGDDISKTLAAVVHSGKAQRWDLPEAVKVKEFPDSALVLPIAQASSDQPAGLLVAGISPKLALEQEYRGFFELVAGNIASAIASVRAYEEERKRGEALAELDRAKTVFFSNVSHEFRTPLTLILGPVEDALADTENPLPPVHRERIEVLQRNGMRLLKLVNTLLDFSRLEAGRVQAVYEPIDLAALTADLASLFRSAVERGGLQLIVNCPLLPCTVYVDRQMWEKIVLNLLSNALKFTFEGEIEISLYALEDRVSLIVRDTGVGIEQADLPYLFKRFHRVENTRARTQEGSGIGLALVQELVRLHGGTVEVSSVVSRGSIFTVTLPTGSAHLPPERIGVARTLTSTALGAAPYIEEALRWQLDTATAAEAVSVAAFPTPSDLETPARILLADDNADMRDYVKRLLQPRYQVQTVTDGLAAIHAARQQVPDLVLTDVMMPGLDGFELLRHLRADSRTREIPIILLSARAGEESRVEGLVAGADDYLIKPFSARELLARVESSLKMAQMRQEAALREQELRLQSQEAQRVAEDAYDRINQILESMSDAFIALDRDWRITYQNAAAERINGKPRSETLGKTQWEEWPASVGTNVEYQYRRAMAEQIPIHFEHRYYSPPTYDLWLEIHVYPFNNGLGVFYRDITARKQAEEEREQLFERERSARAEAEKANRIKDEFLAVLSHELRSPLNPILGWSKLLRTRNFDEATIARALETIERNAKLQIQLIEDLLDVSRILRGKLSLNICPVNLVSTVESAMETVRLAASSKSIEIETIFDPNVGEVLGDSARLQQVVWNLLSNAVKFTSNGGRVEVRLELAGAYVQLIVSDTGKGIDQSFLPYVFDYFRQESSTTTRQFGGLGLGLAIVRNLVEMHGGTVQAFSRGLNQGATFTVSLPLINPPNFAVEENNQSALCLQLDGVRVLVVDDETDSRELLTFILEQYGASVTAVESSFAALEALPQTQPHLLISDIGMPQMDGYMLMRSIREMPADRGGMVRAIAITAYASESERQLAIDAGFQMHLSKPIEPDELTAAIAKLTKESA